MLHRRLVATALVVASLIALTAASPASASVGLTTQWKGTLDGFGQPIGVAVDPSGQIYVASRALGAVQKLNPFGGFLAEMSGTFTNPFGVAIGPSGDIYVADTNNFRVQQFDSAGNFIRMWGKNVGGSGVDMCTSPGPCSAGIQGNDRGQFWLADSVATDTAGNVYVSDSNYHRVQKFSASGVFERMWGNGVNQTTGGDICTGGDTCKDGSLGVGGGEFSGPAGLAVDSSSNVYVADSGNHVVQKFNSSGAFLRMWGKNVGGAGVDTCTSPDPCGGGAPGTEAGEFSGDRGVAIDSAGDLFVVDSGNRRVQEFGPSGAFTRMWGNEVGGPGVDVCTSTCVTGTPGGGGGEFALPARAATSSSGHVYVTDSTNQNLQEFGSAGNFIRMWGYQVGGQGFNTCTSSCVAGSLSGSVPFDDPEDVARDSSGNVYVADFNNGRVHKFDSLGRSLFWFGGLGTGAAEMGGPEGVAVAGSGDIYVADYSNNRIDQFDSTGSFVRTWGKDVNVTNPGDVCTANGDTCGIGTAASSDGAFNSPSGVALDSSGNLYVADSSNNRIQKFNSSGTYLSQFGTAGTAAGQLQGPWKLAIDGAGNIYVTEQDNNRVSEFSSSGTFVRALGKNVGGTGVNSCTSTCQQGTAGSGDGAFNAPNGISTDSVGNIYVSEGNPNNRVQVFSPAGAFIEKWGSTGSADGQFAGAGGLVAASGGRVYVADGGNNRIQLFTDPALVPTPPPTGGGGSGDGGSTTTSTDGAGTSTPGSTPAPTGTPGSGPTAAQILAALTADLRTAARALTRAGIRTLLRKRGLTLAGIVGPARGTLRFEASASSTAAAKVVVLRGTRSYTAAGSGKVRLTLTKAGARLLRRVRGKVVLTLRASFTDAAGLRTRASRKVTIRRG